MFYVTYLTCKKHIEKKSDYKFDLHNDIKAALMNANISLVRKSCYYNHHKETNKAKLKFSI